MKCSIISESTLFAKIKTIFTKIDHNMEYYTCDPLKYKTDNPILIVYKYVWGNHPEYKGLKCWRNIDIIVVFDLINAL